MRPSFWLAVLAVALFVHSVSAEALEHSISTSRQFVVYGGDVRLRGLICDLAEKTKRDLLQLLDQRDEWPTPIVIQAQFPQANLPETPRSALNLAQTGFGLKLQLDLLIDREVNPAQVRRELLRALLVERMYRSKADLLAGMPYASPPAWLLDGIPAFGSDFDSKLIDILSIPVATGKVLSLQEFLRIQDSSDFDGPSRLVYRAYAFAIVNLLTQTSKHGGQLARFIADLPCASSDVAETLRLHFPELGDLNNAEKKWSAHIERLATSHSVQLLSVEETDKKLDELLVLTVSVEGKTKKFSIDQFAQFVRFPAAKSGLDQLSRDVSLLATRAHPICRPVVDAYARLVAQLAHGKTSGITERLSRLKVARKRTTAHARKVSDYMNWFEATQSRRPSGAFTDYLKAAERSSQPKQRRRDPISVYLDSLEMQFED